MEKKRVQFDEPMKSVSTGGFTMKVQGDQNEDLPKAVKMRNQIKKASAKKKSDCVNTPIAVTNERPMTRQEKRREGKPLKIMSGEEREAMKAKYRDRKKAMKELIKGAGKRRRALRMEREEEENRKRKMEDVEMQEDAVDTALRAMDEPRAKRRRKG